MLIDIAFVMAGLAILVFAGDALVRGAVALSLKLGISALVVSLTVVAFGTSAPEMLVSVKAVLDGSTELVFGNIVGSNIANVLLVLGIPALITPIVVCQDGVRRNFSMMIAASVLFIAVSGYGGVWFWIGIAFLVLLAAMLFDAYLSTLKSGEEVTLEDAPEGMSGLLIGISLVGGLIGLPIGAHLLIEGARGVALGFGVSEAAIGLTLVAIGTSLPELATTVMAAIRRQSDVAVGNVIGSNLFNILGVMGVAALFGDLPTPEGFMALDFWVMLAASALIGPYIFLRKDIGRISGLLFLVVYIVYIVFALGPRM